MRGCQASHLLKPLSNPIHYALTCCALFCSASSAERRPGGGAALARRGVLAAPKLLDVAVLYGAANPALTQQLVQQVPPLSSQAAFVRLLRKTCVAAASRPALCCGRHRVPCHRQTRPCPLHRRWRLCRTPSSSCGGWPRRPRAMWRTSWRRAAAGSRGRRRCRQRWCRA